VSDKVLVEQRDGVQVITINRPEAKNALDAGVARGVAAAVDELDASDELRVGVLTGAGGIFSAGMDLKGFLKGETPSIEGRGLCGITITPPRKPLIGAVEGWALAGGFELLLACDLVVAADTARFGVPEVKRSLVAGAGAAFELASVVAANGPLAVAATKQIARSSDDWTLEEGWLEQTRIMTPVFDSEDAREGAAAFAEKRPPMWKGR
jgi:enoyl-CoA hydratase